MVESELQERYFEFQVIEEQIRHVAQQVQELNSKLIELEYIKVSLGDFQRTPAGTQVLAPISSGVFFRAKLADNQKLLVNVGAGTVVAKSVEDTQKLMDEQAVEVDRLRQAKLAKLQELTKQAHGIEQELRRLSQEG